MIKVCEGCGIRFTSYKSQNRRFCSPQCWHEWYKWNAAKVISVESHDAALFKEMWNLEMQGFRCIPLGGTGYPVPDLIAINPSDQKVYAVEVELTGAPNYKKYEKIACYDDVIWVIRKQ